jgi:hypothetical protein
MELSSLWQACYGLKRGKAAREGEVRPMDMVLDSSVRTRETFPSGQQRTN